jgi:hypothetical protein
MKNSIFQRNQTLVWLVIFGIAMGFLEAIVVVYMRQLHYPNGFDFPLMFLSPDLLLIEWVRELATIIMLVAIGIIAGKTKLQRFLYFLFSFAIWDLIYYVALKLFLDWPASLFTWDILFLIPIPWIGPVLAPIICSFTMIFFAVGIITREEKSFVAHLSSFDWLSIIVGATIIFYSFIMDYLSILTQHDFLGSFLTLSNNQEFWDVISQYKPVQFSWIIFSAGEILLLTRITIIIRRMKCSGDK